jgi:hypothetical protein
MSRPHDHAGIRPPTWVRAALSHPWRTCSPTPRPAGWSCAWTAPRPRSAGPAPTEWAGGRSSPASASKTPASPPSAATRTAAPCGPGRCGPAACTTRPASRPRASPTCWRSIPRSRSGSTRATGNWPPRSPSSSPPHPASHPRTPPPWRWLPGSKPAPSSPQHGSAWNMRSPSTSSGAPCSAISAAGSPSSLAPGWLAAASQRAAPTT